MKLIKRLKNLWRLSSGEFKVGESYIFSSLEDLDRQINKVQIIKKQNIIEEVLDENKTIRK